MTDIKNRMYLESFIFEKGCFNDYIVKILKEFGVDCYWTFNGDVVTCDGNHKVDVEQEENNKFCVYIEFLD